MKKNTLEEYKSAVKAKYEIEKSGVNSDFLISPSPAKLRDLCKLLCERGLNANDEGIMKRFFGEPSSTLTILIKDFDIDKLKPIRNFLIKGSEPSTIESINLAALLVSFENRPFLKFAGASNNTDNSMDERVGMVVNFVSELTSDKSYPGSAAKKKVYMWVIGTVIVILSAFGVKTKYFPSKDCMVWRTDRYEEIQCNLAKNNIALYEEAIPIDAEVLTRMRKINVYPQTVFFQNGKPMIWYNKEKGNVEFFTSPGNHPNTGKPLKPITQYMINKYVLKK